MGNLHNPIRADFYVGMECGNMEWLGSLGAGGSPQDLACLAGARTEQAYRDRVHALLIIDDHGYLARDGWPWVWANSIHTHYAYSHDGESTFAALFGYGWVHHTAWETTKSWYLAGQRTILPFPDFGGTYKIRKVGA